MAEQKTPIDFADDLLEAWCRYYFDSEIYLKWGQTYADAIAQIFVWKNEDKVLTLKQFHNLLGLAIDSLEKAEKK